MKFGLKKPEDYKLRVDFDLRGHELAFGMDLQLYSFAPSKLFQPILSKLFGALKKISASELFSHQKGYQIFLTLSLKK